MWTCPRCRTENKDSTNFCKRCGEHVATESKQQDKSNEQTSQLPPATPQQRTQPPPAPLQPQPRPQSSQPIQRMRPPAQSPQQSSLEAGDRSAPEAGAKPPTAADAQSPATAKRPLLNKRLIQAAQKQAELSGESGGGEEHIDWSSPSTIAGAMRTQVAERRKGSSALPSDMRSELFGDDNIQAVEPRPDPSGLSLLARVEASVSKRTLMLIVAMSLVALGATLIGSNSVINSFDEGETPTLPVASLHIASLAGVWLGLDRSQGSPGIPVTYLFTRPNWLIVTEPNAAGSANGVPTVVGQASYRLAKGTLFMQPLGAPNLALLPSTTSVRLRGDTVKFAGVFGDGSTQMQLARPGAIEGIWQAGSAKYDFNNGKLAITGAGAKPQEFSCVVTGGAMQVLPSPAAPASGGAQMWQFTFDGDSLLLYLPDPGNPSAPLNFSAPLRLTRSR